MRDAHAASALGLLAQQRRRCSAHHGPCSTVGAPHITQGGPSQSGSIHWHVLGTEKATGRGVDGFGGRAAGGSVSGDGDPPEGEEERYEAPGTLAMVACAEQRAPAASSARCG